MPAPRPDLSVRVAEAGDAAAIAALQLRAWRTAYDGLLPGEAIPDDVGAATRVWAASLTAPGDARNRVLVALDRDRLVGLAVTTPATDPDCDPVADAELAELVVDSDERGRGHGSRLLQAAVDTMRADRFTEAVAWTVAADEGLRDFLRSAGWDADGAHRELDLDGAGTTRVEQVRLHTRVG